MLTVELVYLVVGLYTMEKSTSIKTGY